MLENAFIHLAVSIALPPPIAIMPSHSSDLNNFTPSHTSSYNGLGEKALNLTAIFSILLYSSKVPSISNAVSQTSIKRLTLCLSDISLIAFDGFLFMIISCFISFSSFQLFYFTLDLIFVDNISKRTTAITTIYVRAPISLKSK